MCFPSGFIKISWPVSRFDVFFSYNCLNLELSKTFVCIFFLPQFAVANDSKI